MPDVVGSIVNGLLGFAASVAGTLAEAVLRWLGSVVQGLAVVANAVLSLLPNASNLGLSIPSGWLYGYTVLDTMLPLHEALAMVAVLVGIHLAVIAWHIGVTVYHLIPKPWVGT